MNLPIVAVVGKPNVGKSTLFNRLAGQNLAIVHDAPGVTRDRHYADAFVHGRELTLVDTGGFDPDSGDPMEQGIARHVLAAIAEADLVLCVLDGSAPDTTADREAITLLRRSGKSAIFVANKVDGAAQQSSALSLYELGLDRVIPVSALHGRGLGALGDALLAALPSAAPQPALGSSGTLEGEAAQQQDGAGDPEADTSEHVARLALIGRPNAGKSSLFNRLAGDERSLVDDRPGTTRDPVDKQIRFANHDYVVVDTAGVRRRSKVDEGVESISVMRAIRALGRADVALVLCDATEGLAEQDARLLGLCADRGRAIVVALNKMDLLGPRERAMAVEHAQEKLHFARWASIVEVSAKTGKGVQKLMRTAWDASTQFRRRVGTSELNRFFEQVLDSHPPPTHGGRAPRIYYVTQARTAPPQFVAKCSYADNIQPSYRRFVSNQLRKSFGFDHVPLTVHYRDRTRNAR